MIESELLRDLTLLPQALMNPKLTLKSMFWLSIVVFSWCQCCTHHRSWLFDRNRVASVWGCPLKLQQSSLAVQPTEPGMNVVSICFLNLSSSQREIVQTHIFRHFSFIASRTTFCVGAMSAHTFIWLIETSKSSQLARSVNSNCSQTSKCWSSMIGTTKKLRSYWIISICFLPLCSLSFHLKHPKWEQNTMFVSWNKPFHTLQNHCSPPKTVILFNFPPSCRTYYMVIKRHVSLWHVLLCVFMDTIREPSVGLNGQVVGRKSTWRSSLNIVRKWTDRSQSFVREKVPRGSIACSAIASVILPHIQFGSSGNSDCFIEGT